MSERRGTRALVTTGKTTTAAEALARAVQAKAERTTGAPAGPSRGAPTKADAKASSRSAKAMTSRGQR